MKEFVHKPYQKGETIAAIATPLGEGGIAVIRISGDNALDVASSIFSGPVKTYKTHTAHFGKIVDQAGNLVDEALILVMRNPRSYTGEDTVEIHCHGGSLITRRVLDTVIKAGARPAQPGEFTFRAFINGKLDLAQAEAVQELIAARSDFALNSAEEQLSGKLSQKITSFQAELVDTAAILEAWVDFPEEGIEFASMEEIIASLESTRHKMDTLRSTFQDGKILHHGLSLCLAGPPNVGKSSLMNLLLGKERAIVTNIPGTTRDLLEDQIRLGGLHFRLTDTAGIRETEEVIEQEGIRRSKQAMKGADLVLLVFDATAPLGEEHQELLASAKPDHTIVVWNKIDLPHTKTETAAFPHQVYLSAKEGTGLDSLRASIDRVIWKKGPPSKEEVFITSARHEAALSQAITFCDSLISGLKSDVSPEFLASDMRAILQELGTIIGTNITEDVLSAIFSKFCIGK
jgi:tRNA modification GTPase